MPDIREHFRRQAQACRALGSPFTGLVCGMLAERLDETTALGRRVLSWSGDAGADALALRAAGGLNALARSGRDAALTRAYPPNSSVPEALWEAIETALRTHEDALTAALDGPPQTNEVKRCGALLGGCLLVAARFGLPLSLLEIGSSAGLILGLDRYRYELEEGAWGDSASPVVVPCAWSGFHPALDAPLTIVSRRGCDLRPVDPSSAEERERMLAYVWPDQRERLALTEAALALAAAAPWRVERADAGAWLEERLAEPAPGQARVVLHSIVWQYLPEPAKARAEAAIRRAGKAATPDSPVAWLRMEADAEPGSAALTLSVWPGEEDVPLGRADFHGRWVRWSS